MINDYELFIDAQHMRVGLTNLKTGAVEYRECSLEYPLEYWERVVETQERLKKIQVGKND